ncbi:MAG: F0F1 ATP synthase subunit gamma [Actinomycetota bacterium]|nr:F0F1 ATP synthase subunit gamma [Actinomycetota bacterium]
MAEQLRVVKRRIGSVQSTQKITRAMELISSSRIIKAQQRVDAARPYAETMRRLLVSVAQNAGSLDHPLLAEREDISTVGHIVVSSDRGLAGAYNSNVLRTTERDIAEHGKEARLFLTGKKAVSYFRFRGYDTSDSWTGVSDRPSIDDARAVAQAAADAFSQREVDQVRLTYTRFESAMRQSVVVNQVLPLPREELDRDQDEDQGRRAGYEFEPAPEEILDYLLPRYLEGTVYEALLEASASEHAARRRAMKAATDNAEELLGDLTRDYNQARQAEITTEIMEVVGGAEALMGASSGEGEGN